MNTNIFQNIIQFNFKVDFEFRNPDFNGLLVHLIGYFRQVIVLQSRFQRMESGAFVWQNNYKWQAGIRIFQFKCSCIEVMKRNVVEIRFHMHKIDWDTVRCIGVEISFGSVWSFELILPSAFEINCIHQNEPSVRTNHVWLDEIFDFVVCLVFDKLIDRANAISWVGKIQWLNAGRELFNGHITEFFANFLPFLDINLIGNR